MHNVELIGRNMALHDWSQEIIKKLKKMAERNTMLIKENAKLYHNLRMLRLKLKELEGTEVPPVATEAPPSGLDALAEVAMIPEEVTPMEAQQRQTKRVTGGKRAASKKS